MEDIAERDVAASDRDSQRKNSIIQHRLRKWELLTLEGGSMLERLLSRLQERYDIISRIPQLLESPTGGLPEAAAFYGQHAQAPIDSVFLPPRVVPEVSSYATEARGAGEVTEIRFQSDFKPLYPEFNEEFDSCVQNKWVFCRVWRQPHGESLGTIVLIPGWYMTDPRLSAIALLPGYFFSRGYNVLIYELPYTHRRISNPAKRFPSSNLLRTNEGILQAVYELRQIKLWLEAQGERIEAVLGASFGGYLSALFSCVEEIPKVVTVSAVVDLLSMIEKLFSTSDDEHTLAALQMAYDRIFASCPRAQLAEALSIHSPLRFASQALAQNRLVLSATQDLVVPPQETEKLLSHWQGAQHVVVPGGHFGQLCTTEAQKALAAFLER